ncbi:hypothetical protein HK105_209036 [Polyrhizophydium stewartii]|uniref:Uncharacterized protein n=1 Tax=Polyrhizophydium stewartii TaxID=2732419 RepID=A0ABR4MW56_9FUNG
MRRARVKVQSLKPKATASSSVFSARGGSPLSQTSQDSDTPDPAQSAQLTAAIETQTAAIRTRIARLLRLLRATTNELAAVLERLRTRVPGVDRASHATDLWAGGMAYGHESFVVEAFHELAQIEQHAVALAREAGIDWLAQV